MKKFLNGAVVLAALLLPAFLTGWPAASDQSDAVAQPTALE